MTLQRRTPLARSGPLKKTSSRPKRTRDTGPTPTTRGVVWTRAGGRCEVCAGPVTGLIGFSLHHRHPRRMGGSRRPELNTPANLLLVCGSGTTGCHGRIEANRERAYEDGHLIPAGLIPADVPVMLADPNHPSHWPRLVWLHDDGTYTEENPA